jgi:hypothetical protein
MPDKNPSYTLTLLLSSALEKPFSGQAAAGISRFCYGMESWGKMIVRVHAAKGYLDRYASMMPRKFPLADFQDSVWL